MKDGAILCNSGHFDVEIDIAYLNDTAKQIERNVTNHVDAYLTRQRPYALYSGPGAAGESRLRRGSSRAGDGYELRDPGAGLALDGESDPLPVKVHDVPQDIEHEVAGLKLAAMGIHIDALSDEQKKYLTSWQTGT